jgi:dynein heavy chain
MKLVYVIPVYCFVLLLYWQDAVIRKLKKYIDDPQYQPETVAKQSKAAMSLCMWTRAMDVYHRVAKVS